MAQFTILENVETGSTKYHALSLELEQDGEKWEVDCVVCEYSDANSTHSHFEIVSVHPEEIEEAVRAIEDEIINAM